MSFSFWSLTTSVLWLFFEKNIITLEGFRRKCFKKLHDTLQYSRHHFLLAFSQAHYIFPFSAVLVCWKTDTTEGEGNYSCSLAEKMRFSNLEIGMQPKWTWLSCSFFFFFKPVVLSHLKGQVQFPFNSALLAWPWAELINPAIIY